MGDNIVHVCRHDSKIAELSEGFKELRSHQYNDHDLLVRLDTKIDAMGTTLVKFTDSIEKMSTQPSERYEKLKISGISTAVGIVLTYLFTKMIGG